MKEKRNVFSSFFVLKTDKGQVKMPIDEKGFKDFKQGSGYFLPLFLKSRVLKGTLRLGVLLFGARIRGSRRKGT